MERWTGRVAVVTGCSSGIGAAVCTLLVKSGLQVVGLARRVEIVQELADSLKDETGKLYAVKTDITKPEEVSNAFAWIVDNLGGVDILVNNAGVDSTNTLIDGPYESWQFIFEVNVLGLCSCAKEAIKSMRSRGVDDGHIININSIVGHMIPPNDFPKYAYCASKYAVTALTEGLRRELAKQGSKIRVTDISPGIVKTDFFTTSGIPSEDVDTMFQQIAHLEPDDIANSITYVLATPPHVQIKTLTIKPVGELF